MLILYSKNVFLRILKQFTTFIVYWINKMKTSKYDFGKIYISLLAKIAIKYPFFYQEINLAFLIGCKILTTKVAKIV